jgi:hypothetical protein
MGPARRVAEPQLTVWNRRNTVFMAWKLLNLARIVKDAGGIRDFITPPRSLAWRRYEGLGELARRL